MGDERYPVVRYTTLEKGRLKYHSIYDIGCIELANLKSKPATRDIIYPQGL